MQSANYEICILNQFDKLHELTAIVRAYRNEYRRPITATFQNKASAINGHKASENLLYDREL